MKKQDDGLDVHQFKSTSIETIVEESPAWLTDGLIVRKKEDDLMVIVNRSADLKALQEKVEVMNRKHEKHVKEYNRQRNVLVAVLVIYILTSIVTNLIK